MGERHGSQRLGDLVFSKRRKWSESRRAQKRSFVRASLLLLLGACVSLSACSIGDVPLDQGSTAPSPSSPQRPSVSPTASEESRTPPSIPISPSPATSETPNPVDPNDVPPDDTDYSQDVGITPQQYEYEPELEPAESVVATLCNLNQEFFKGLRTVEGGVAVADSTLRTGTVALDDLTDYWETLRAQYPDAAADIDTGVAVQEQWKTALLNVENGDDASAKTAMVEAEKLIEKLPKTTAVDCHE